MPGPFDAAGVVKQPTAFGALDMGARQMTGMWTQRTPYRDAAVPYLYSKFYSASRFDSILDGINREISMRLSDVRRPASSVYNSNTFPQVLSFYSFSCIQNLARTIRVMIDGQDGNVYDGTAGGKVNIFTKTGTAKTRFLGVGNELFFSDGVDLEAWLTPNLTWAASTSIQPGQLINSGTSPYHLQMALGGLTMTVVGSSSDGTHIFVYFDPENIPDQFANLQGANVTFAGCTLATSLNGNTYAATVISSTLGILRVTQAQSAYVQAADTGTGTTGTGTTGATIPTFSSTKFAITADAGQQWKCYGPAVLAWGLPAPTKAPVLAPANGTRWWQPNFTTTTDYAILDSNQNVEVVANPGNKTGATYPTWSGVSATSVGVTQDGATQWNNLGGIGGWAASTAFYTFPSGATGGTGVCVILDSNGNLQWVTNGGGGMSGGSAPTWATTVGATTTDGALTWTCLGPGAILTTATIKYGFSTHGVDGSVSTSSPAAIINGPILGEKVAAADAPLTYLTVQCILNQSGGGPNADQTDQVWIWRTAQGQATLIQEDQVPIDGFQSHVGPNPYIFLTYDELGIPDTSNNGGGSLDALIAAPVALSNAPPAVQSTAPVYHLNRVWMILGNSVVYSGGPDTVVGNGNTAFSPLNAISFQGVPIRMVPVTVENGALMVYTTAGVFLILGTGTSSNPFYATLYYDKVILAGYDAFDTIGNTHFLMESNLKVSSIAVQYPFNPQTGYTEIGFPIGDQFMKVTTGGISSTLYNGSGTFLSWNIANTTDTGMYVADGSVGWFRMSNAAPPESGLIWSPRAAIYGGTSAVQSIEVSPGVFKVLIGPPSGGGRIRMRDTTATIWGDLPAPTPGGGQPLIYPYPAWDVKGVILLCSTGQEAELAWIATKSLAVGSRPTIGLLFDEIGSTQALPFSILQPTNQDPANLQQSTTAYCDQYKCLQNGFTPKGDCVSIKFDYGSQEYADELMDFQIFGAKEELKPAATGGA
jgi:hypothetical protein